MLKIEPLYNKIYADLQSIYLADVKEKESKYREQQANDQQFQSRISYLDSIINEILPYQKAASAYVPNCIAQQAIIPQSISLSFLNTLYCQAVTATTNASSIWERLYTSSKAGIIYYQNKKNDLLSKKVSISSYLSSRKYDEECQRVLKSNLVQQLVQLFHIVEKEYSPKALVNKPYSAPQEESAPLFGRIAKPFPVTDGCIAITKQLFGGYFSAEDCTLLMPCTLPDVTLFQIGSHIVEPIMSSIRAYILAFLCYTKPSQSKVYYIDTCTMDSNCLGVLRVLLNQNEDIIMHVPTNQEEVRKLLTVLRQSLVSSALHDRRLLIYRFRQSSHDSQCDSQIQWLCANASSYNLQIICVQEVSHNSENLEQLIPVWFTSNTLILRFGTHQCLEVAKTHSKIATYSEPAVISEEFLNTILQAYVPTPLETRYFKIQPILIPPVYHRDRNKAISLLYGIGDNGEKYSLDLVGGDFSAYILGAARSGKSNLLHVLITSALINYHPDDLELWLVDFGRTEFVRYIDHTPPHARYILAEKTTELISGLVDKLIAEMDRRGDILSRNHALKIQELPDSIHLPLLLVMIDEFGVFKEILSSDEFEEKKKYKAYMERLLKQGAKHGICFIFANQSFTDVYSALPEEGSDQIGLRLAMYANNKTEMKAVLETKNSHLSEEEDVRISRLPVYQVLVRSSRQNGNLSRPIHVLDMTKDEDRKVQEQFIDGLNHSLRPIAKSRTDKSTSYIAHQQLCLKYDLTPTFADRFPDIKNDYNIWKQNVAFQSTDLLIYLGEPRNMDPVHHELLRNQRAENILLYGDYARSLKSIASVVAGAVNSAIFQQWPVEFWCNDKDLLGKMYFDKWNTGTIVKEHKKLVARVRELNNNIKENLQEKRLIIVSGLSSIILGIQEELEEQSVYGNERDISKAGLDEIRRLMEHGGVTESQLKETEIEDLSPYMNPLLKFGPRHNIHFMVVIQREMELHDSNLTIESFSHYVAFSNGLSDTDYYFFKRKINGISSNDMFGCLTGNAEFTVYRPFSM